MSKGDQEEYGRFQYLQGMINPIGLQRFRIVTDVLLILGGWAAVTVEVFLRRSFGARYLTSLRLMFGAFVLGGYNFIVVIRYALSPGSAIWELGTQFFLWGFFLAFIVRSFFVRFDIWYRDTYTPHYWPTKSIGFSKVFRGLEGKQYGPWLPLDEWFIYRFVEPLATIFVGWLLWIIGLAHVLPTTMLGAWIIFAGWMLLFRNNTFYIQSIDEVRDLTDARIKAASMRASSRGTTPQPLAGYIPPRLPLSLDTNNDNIADVLQAAPRIPRASMDDILKNKLRRDDDGQGNQS